MKDYINTDMEFRTKWMAAYQEIARKNELLYAVKLFKTVMNRFKPSKKGNTK